MDLIVTLLNKYCKGDRLRNALAAYYYFRIYIREPRTGRHIVEAVLRERDIAEKLNDVFGYHIASILDSAIIHGRSPTAIAIEKNDPEAYEFFRSMGIKSNAQDLTAAIDRNNTALAEQLLNQGAPVDDPTQSLEGQPLYAALNRLNEPLIERLLKAGASFTTKYKLTLGNTTNINEYFRSILERRLALLQDTGVSLLAGKTPEEANAFYHRQLQILNEQAELQKAMKASAETKENWLLEKLGKFQQWFK